MGLALTIARRSLVERPGRTLFSIVGIALGIATVVGVVVLDYNTILGLSGPHLDRGVPDIDLRPTDGRAGESGNLADVDGVSAVTAYFQNEGVARAVPAGAETDEAVEQRRIAVIGIEAEKLPLFGMHRIVDGRELDPDTTAPEVLLGSALAEKLGVGPGDDVRISRPRRIGRRICVDGQLVEAGPSGRDEPREFDFEVVGILGRDNLGRRSQGMVAILDFEWGEAVYDGAGITARYLGRRDPSVDLERLKTSLAASYSYELNKGVILGQAADERAFRTGVRVAGLLALVLGLYVIFHTLSMSLHERIGEVGTLHALGSTRAQVGRIFLLEAVILAGAGAILGVAGGLALAKTLLYLGVTTLGAQKYVTTFVVPWGTVGALAGVGFGIALIGSVYPLVTIGGANTVSALRGEAALRASRGVSVRFHLLYALLLALVLPGLYFVIVPVVGEFTAELVSILLGAVGFLAFIIVLSLIMPRVLSTVCDVITKPFTTLWPLAGRLAAHSIRHAPTRIGVSTSAIALVAAGLVGLKGMTNSLRGEVEVWAEEAAVDKTWVRDLPEMSFETLASHLHQYPGVIGVEKGNARHHASFLMLGVDVDEIAGYGPCAEDPAILRKLKNRNGIILSRRVAADLDKEVGHSIPVAKGDGHVQEFEIVAISDAYGHHPSPDERMYGVISDSYMERYFCMDTDTVTDVAVRLEPGTDPRIVEDAVRDLLPDVKRIGFEPGSMVLDEHLMDIGRDFVLFDVLIVLTAALACLGVLNGQLLAALERAKEIGIIKAMGTSRRQVAGMVVLESAVVGLVGGALGALLGAALTPIVVTSLEQIAGLDLPHRAAGTWIGVAICGSIALALLSGLYPIFRMNRFDPVKAVRTG